MGAGDDDDDDVLGKKGRSAESTSATGKGPLTGGANGKKSGMKLKDEGGNNA